MATKQYVQHISGQGAKWLVQYEGCTDYQVLGESIHYLPKSEYVLCPPPERWVDVTAECTLDACGAVMHHGFNTFGDERYRRRKVQIKGSECPKLAIIIEQKVTD